MHLAPVFSVIFRITVFSMCLSGTAGAADASRGPVPQVLSEDDISLYRRIFSLQETGQWSKADSLIARLDDEILLGYVLFQRYMHPVSYRSGYEELRRWLKRYADHPDAHRIYRLALRRRPQGVSGPPSPVPRKWVTGPEKAIHPALEADYTITEKTRVRKIEKRIRYLADRKRAMAGLSEINRHLADRTITTRQYDRMRGWIAASLYYQGYIDKARTLSEKSAARSGDAAVTAHWIAGLIAFRHDNMDHAYSRFSTMASTPYQSDSMRAAAAFWSARTALKAGYPEKVLPHLDLAASFPFTFYGQIALAQLGHDYRFNWRTPQLTGEHTAIASAHTDRIRRAVALWQTGRYLEAETELQWANGSIGPEMKGTLLGIAAALDMPAAQIDIALSGTGKHLEPGLFPVPAYAPGDGFKIDRALLFALMRQESKFRTQAKSHAGARGLMQLMPHTASYIGKDRSLRSKKGMDRLYDPSLNLSLAQRYIIYLLDKYADSNLFDLAAAYNGGPGNLKRWKERTDIADPLLFIESIPNRESRHYVKKVLANLWIYRSRLGQEIPSRTLAAAGNFPPYTPLDAEMQKQEETDKSHASRL